MVLSKTFSINFEQIYIIPLDYSVQKAYSWETGTTRMNQSVKSGVIETE